MHELLLYRYLIPHLSIISDGKNRIKNMERDEKLFRTVSMHCILA